MFELVCAAVASLVAAANPGLNVQLDTETGRISVQRTDNTGFVLKDGGPVLIGDFGTINLQKPAQSSGEESFQDRLGQGTQRTLRFDELSCGGSFEWIIKTYEDRPWVGLSGKLSDAKGKLDEIVVLQGEWQRPGNAGTLRAFVESSDQINPRGSFDVTESGVVSQFVTALYDPEHKQGAGLGFYSLNRAPCRFNIVPKGGRAYGIKAAAVYRGYDLSDPRGVESEYLLLDFSTDPLECLENYARCAARQLGIKPFTRAALQPSLYNAWFVFGVRNTAEDMYNEAVKLKDTIFLQELRRPRDRHRVVAETLPRREEKGARGSGLGFLLGLGGRCPK